MARPEQSPNTLPPELAAFLKDHLSACLAQATDRGTVLLLKAPGHEIESVRGKVPILLRHELYQQPTAPVIRIVLTLYDQPARPLAFETFINVEDPQQRADYAALAKQPTLLLLFYDERLNIPPDQRGCPPCPGERARGPGKSAGAVARHPRKRV